MTAKEDIGWLSRTHNAAIWLSMLILRNDDEASDIVQC